jgi:accessory secretory protein Asp1
MFYIMPAWENEVSELNRDLLKNLTNVFVGGKKSVKLAVLNFLPNLRYLLHVNGLTNYEYWNIWDAILGIERVDGMPLGPEALDLPQGVRLINAMTSMDAYEGSKLYARIIRSSEGYLSEVQFMNPQNRHTDVYDDRGFKVCTNYYENEEVVRQEWFNECNQLIVRYEPKAKVAVQILGNYSNFEKRQYKTLNELLMEFVNSFFEEHFDPTQDRLIASTNLKIRPLMVEIQKRLPVTYLLDHLGPMDTTTVETLQPQIQGAFKFVVPNYVIFQQIKSSVAEPAQKVLKLGYPYGTENRLGNSNEESKMFIYWHIDESTNDATCSQFAEKLIDYSLEHENVGLQVAALNDRQANLVFNYLCQALKNKYTFLDLEQDQDLIWKIVFGREDTDAIGKLLMQLKFRLGMNLKHNPETNPQKLADSARFKKINWKKVMEDITETIIRVNSRDNEIYRNLARSRVLVDVGSPYNTRMQFNAISAGIPQIVNVDSPFIINRKNGWIINEKQSLSQGLDFYLQELVIGINP